MPKKWTELTPDEIDTLESEVLSWVVGEAMGYRVYVGSCTKQLCARKDGAMKYWHPHSDANQALEVWRELCKLDDHMQLTMAINDAMIDTLMPDDRCPIVAEGAFCEAICRAYLKVRLADDANES